MSLEEEILGGHGYVDVMLEKGVTRIACEISVTTRVLHELGNLTKCLSVDFSHVVFLSSSPSVLKSARSKVAADARLHLLTPEKFIGFLENLDGTGSSEVPEKRRNQGDDAAGVRRGSVPNSKRGTRQRTWGSHVKRSPSSASPAVRQSPTSSARELSTTPMISKRGLLSARGVRLPRDK